MSTPAFPARLPLVGRSADLEQLRAWLERTRAGEGRVLALSGDPGVGKSRLAAALADEARHAGWAVAAGRAYPIETGTPYALFADAFVPLLREIGPARLTVLARGGEAQLLQLFPALAALRPGGGPQPSAAPAADPTQLFWTFAELLRSLVERQPLLVLLDDLHRADVSSLELLHFAARQLTRDALAVVCTVNDAERDAHPTLDATLRSLDSLGLLRRHPVRPLTLDQTDDLVREAFGADPRVTREFTALLYGWTRGNPFFIEATLEALVESGRLRTEGAGWLGWELDALEMPASVRDAVRRRLERLSPAAREVAELVAVIGARASYDTLAAVAELGEAALVRALEELSGAQLLVEGGTPREPVYEFAHPLFGLTFLSEIGLARRRRVHAGVAEALERRYGERALEHADELAPHFAQGHARDRSPKAVKYLTAAGRSALARFANQEAADYLDAALEHIEANAATPAAEERFRVLEDLGRARQRLGDFGEAIRLWECAAEDALTGGDGAAAAAALRRIGLARFRSGRHEGALEAYGRALELAPAGAEAAALVAQIRLAQGACLEAVGRVEEARGALEAALAGAETAGDARLRARCHRALMLFHTVVGPPDKARSHGAQSVELAEASGDRALACTCHWGMAVLAGLTGQAEACDHHMDQSARIAESLNSPLLRLAADEVQVEHAFGRGDWDTGLAIGERAIALARTLHQRGLLPRLLVWTALIHMGRNDLERARRYVDEAWELAGAGSPGAAADVHSVVPAHIGRASYHMTLWEWDEAIRIGREALAIVDRTGYRAWAVHRLLPIIVEAQLFKGDTEGARETLARLRADAEALDHPLGLAWCDTGDAVLEYLTGDVARSIPLLEAAARRLEAIPYVPDAARLRRQLAGRLAQLGERELALRELRRVHDVLVRLGAERELDRTRVQFHELGARPPRRSAGGGLQSLTEREVEIVRLVAERRSNKAIGKALGISPRTVGTHLSNVYEKLEIGSRMELAARAPALLAEPPER